MSPRANQSSDQGERRSRHGRDCFMAMRAEAEERRTAPRLPFAAPQLPCVAGNTNGEPSRFAPAGIRCCTRPAPRIYRLLKFPITSKLRGVRYHRGRSCLCGGRYGPRSLTRRPRFGGLAWANILSNPWRGTSVGGPYRPLQKPMPGSTLRKSTIWKLSGKFAAKERNTEETFIKRTGS